MPSIADALEELNDKAMTRKEQIKEYLRVIGSGDMENIPFDVGFECGVEWADSHPHWISVEDELPKEGDAILAMQDIQGNHWFTACQFIKADVCRGIVDFFVKSDAHIGISVDGKVTLGHVSHWMPLPAPPKKGDQCND